MPIYKMRFQKSLKASTLRAKPIGSGREFRKVGAATLKATFTICVQPRSLLLGATKCRKFLVQPTGMTCKHHLQHWLDLNAVGCAYGASGSVLYRGATRPLGPLEMYRTIPNIFRYFTGSRCRSCNNGVMRSVLDTLATTRAAACCALWNRCS